MLKAEDVEGQALDHLGLISAVIKDLKLIEKIDSRLPISKEKGAKVSMGQRVAAMILNGLGFTDDRLYMFPEFLKNKPIEKLLGKGLKASDFNDDASGRCLDSISKYGTTPFFTEIAFEVGLENDLLGKSSHIDTTSLTVYGDYETESVDIEASNDKENHEAPFEITYGYSKDHRPDLKQMVLSLATTGAGFPIWMEGHSGSASDKKVLTDGASRMQAFCKSLKLSPSFLHVGDSAFYERCVKEAVTFKWLSRVPERIKEARKWIERPDEDFSWISLADGYKMTTLVDARYGEVKQRWVLIQSEKALERETKTLEKNIEKERVSIEKSLWHLGNQSFKCSGDAEQASIKEAKSLKYHTINFEIIPVRKHSSRGRPKKDKEPIVQGYTVKGLIEKNRENIERYKLRKGRFILASNELDTSELSDNDFLSEYKKQYKTEHGFAFIKNNAFEVSSIFLKKPRRIQALMSVMTLCLMVYSYSQHYLRKSLSDKNETVPNQLKKPTQKPSMSWVFRLFQGIQVWRIPAEKGLTTLVVNLNELTRRIISYFGPTAERIYLSSG